MNSYNKGWKRSQWADLGEMDSKVLIKDCWVQIGAMVSKAIGQERGGIPRTRKLWEEHGPMDSKVWPKGPWEDHGPTGSKV